MHLGDHLLMLVLGILLPLRTLQSAQAGDLKKLSFNSRKERIMYYGNGTFLWMMAFVVLLVWFLSGRPMLELGLSWGILPYEPVAWMVLAVFLVLYGLDLFSEIGTARQRDQSRIHFKENIGFLPASGQEFIHYLFLAFSAGICEEIVFRGYFIRYFEWWFGSGGPTGVALALAIPALIFGVAHLYQGWKAVVKIVAMAIMFGAFFLLTDSIWALVLLHSLVDVLGGVVSWYLLSED